MREDVRVYPLKSTAQIRNKSQGGFLFNDGCVAEDRFKRQWSMDKEAKSIKSSHELFFQRDVPHRYPHQIGIRKWELNACTHLNTCA